MFTKTEYLPGENYHTQVPTHWLRDPRLGSGAKTVLSYWQSHAIGYRVTIEQTIAELAEGRDFVYAAVRDALALGYLERLQGRGGRGRFGSVEYTHGPAAKEQLYERNWGRRSDGTEGPFVESEPGEPVADAPSRGGKGKKSPPVDNSGPGDVSAGGTAYGSAGNGRTGNGAAAYGGTGNGSTAYGESDTKKINPLKDQSLSSGTSEVDQNPPPLSAVTSLPREVEAENRGDENSLSETEKNLLNAAVEQAIAIRSGRPGWSHAEIVEAMQVQLGEHAPVRVAAAIVEAARDVEGTHRPGRLGYLLTAGTASTSALPAGTAQASLVLAPVKYLDRSADVCKRHRGEPADGCNRCAAEVKGADVDAPSVLSGPSMSREAALALARASTRPGTKLRRHEGPWMPQQARTQRSDAMEKLAAAAEQHVEVAS